MAVREREREREKTLLVKKMRSEERMHISVIRIR